MERRPRRGAPPEKVNQTTASVAQPDDNRLIRLVRACGCPAGAHECGLERPFVPRLLEPGECTTACRAKTIAWLQWAGEHGCTLCGAHEAADAAAVAPWRPGALGVAG